MRCGLAPSPDNNQPWRFAGSDEQLSVYLDPQRALPSDVNAMFDLVGVVRAAYEPLPATHSVALLAPRLGPYGSTSQRSLRVSPLGIG